MRMNRLQALRAVMETGSVTEASRRIHRTQPQISRLISALEAEVGFTLFLRQGRGLVPTHECLRFYEGTRHILAGFEEVSRIASSIRNQQDAWLRILTQPYLAYSVTPAAIAEFSRLHPRVKVSLEVRSRVEVGLWMSGPAVRPGTGCPAHRFSRHPLAQFRRRAAGHRHARAPPAGGQVRGHGGRHQGRTLHRAAPYTLLRKHIDDLMEQRRLPLHMVMETSSGQSACQLAALGVGVALADPVLAANVPGIVLRDFEPADPALRVPAAQRLCAIGTGARVRPDLRAAGEGDRAAAGGTGRMQPGWERAIVLKRAPKRGPVRRSPVSLQQHAARAGWIWRRRRSRPLPAISWHFLVISVYRTAIRSRPPRLEDSTKEFVRIILNLLITIFNNSFNLPSTEQANGRRPIPEARPDIIKNQERALNHIYRLVWNNAVRAWQPVSEFAARAAAAHPPGCAPRCAGRAMRWPWRWRWACPAGAGWRRRPTAAITAA